ncbi:NB-ARC domain-containing protein [Abeliophyllum distichum]|uniref:NB-ARC domain-containing protein n=1 Tax=Abeliophyllum distichum TaxID=126358 RepID=A0ABD1V821_9LAMI
MHLKPCFLYFGAFAEATEIPVQKLTSLWVAEGFVERVKQKNSNVVSYGYLTDLISRGLVLVGKRRSDGGVKTCYVHDLLREMCLTIAEKDNFMKVIQDQLPIYVPHHRLSILSSSITPFSRPFGLHVRSLLGYLPEPSRFIFSNMELVKVLDLSTEWSQGTKIGKLELLSLPLNLRKLTLTRLKLNSNEMKMIGELQKLEVLKLESASIEVNEWNPNEGEFQQLRFLKLHNMGGRIEGNNPISDRIGEKQSKIGKKGLKVDDGFNTGNGCERSDFDYGKFELYEVNSDLEFENDDEFDGVEEEEILGWWRRCLLPPSTFVREADGDVL